MGEGTAISWADHTMNPWMGCDKVSPGCAHCYAEALVTNRMGLGAWGPDGVRKRTSEANWRKPLAWNRRAAHAGVRERVFCASLADVFEPRPELETWRSDLFLLIEQTPALDWLLLTKRPEEARDWLHAYYETWQPTDSRSLMFGREWTGRDGIGWGVLPNVWIGTSIENARYTWRADVLREIPAAVRFISAEPLLGSLFKTASTLTDLGSSEHGEATARTGSRASVDAQRGESRAPLDLSGIDWVIVGGESGGRFARPMHPSWARELRDAVLVHEGAGYPCPGCHGLRSALCGDCEAAARERGRPAFHMKQHGSWRPARAGERSDFTFPDGQTMVYAGPYPTSGGKHLDGTDWCELPEPGLALTPA